MRLLSPLLLAIFLILTTSPSQIQSAAWFDYAAFDYPDLFDAIDADRIENVRRLVENGASLEQKKRGLDPLTYALDRDLSVEMAKALLELGCDPEGRYADGSTHLIEVCRRWSLFSSSPSRKKAELVSLLLSFGADIEARSHNGESPLTAAIWSEHPEVGYATIFL